MAPRRIGELLVAEGFLTEGAVQRALGYQRLSGERIKIGSILLNWDLLGEDVLLASLAKLHRCPAVTWEMLLATPIETIRLIPAAQAIRMGAIPWAAEKGIIRVAFANPSNLASLDEVASLTGRRVVPGVTTEARLLQAQQRYYGRHIPLEYRPILQKLDRRSTTSAKVERDFRSSDLVKAERDSVTLSPSQFDLSPGVPIPVDDGAVAAPPAAATRRDSALDLPEFPDIPPAPGSPTPGLPLSSASDASVRDSHPHSPLEGGEDSLTDWVGDALSAFPGTAAARIDAADSESSAGVSDPSLYGREGRESHAFTDDPGALDLLPATNAMRDRPRPPVRRAAPRAAGPDSAPSEAHTLGIPTSIPPFRRATDPAGFENASFPLESDPLESDEVAAGMWKPAPEEEGAVSADSTSAILESAGARRRDEVADSLLEGALEALPRVLLLASGRNGVTGWRGRGPGLTPDSVSSIRVPVSEISIFSSVQESGVPHFGSVDPAEWPRNLMAIFGAAPPDCAIFPIRILDGVAAFLYADRLGAPMQYEDFAIVARASASAANVLSRFLLRSDRAGSPVTS